MTGVLWVVDNPNVTLPQRNPLTGPRVTSFRWDLLDNTEVKQGTLDGAKGGRVDYSNAATIRSSGQLDWAGLTQPDWLRTRIQPWVVLDFPDGSQASWPLGVFLPSTPVVRWTGTGATADVDLYDKLQILVDDAVSESYSVPVGAVVTDVVRGLIAGTGEWKMSIVDSTETLRTPMTWEAGTSRLKIINDLLDAANYFSLSVDGHGYYRTSPYVPPMQRGLAWDFRDDPSQIYRPEFEHERDAFKVPNVVTLISSATGDTPALVSTATNDNPADPMSTIGRGRPVEVVEKGVEATSQAVLDGLAQRRLTDLSQLASTVTIDHAPIPLDLNNRVSFRRTLAGLDLPGVVQAMTVTCDPKALVRTRIREVAA